MPRTATGAPRGRPPSTTRKDEWHINVEQDLSLHFRLKFFDEFTGRTRVGALSELVNRLLREEFMREMKAKGEEK